MAEVDTSKVFNKLRKLMGTVDRTYDPFTNVLRTNSPSINIALANKGYGLPLGYSMILWGPPKSGKSILCNTFIGECHKADTEAYTVTFNTELRGELQQSDDASVMFGIDPERHITFDVNEPELIFDRIEKELWPAVDQGLKLKMIIIDSVTNIVGRKLANADTVNQHLIGDLAATLQDGLKRIQAGCRRRRISLFLTTHARAELDMGEQKRGKTEKMAGAFALKHFAEYFCKVQRVVGKAGSNTLLEESLSNPELQDFLDHGTKTGHRIRFTVDGNSMGPDGRVAEFTLDYQKGIINQYEEIFILGTNFGVIEKPNQSWYQFGDQKWHGSKNCLIAIRDNQQLQNQILDKIYEKDAKSLGFI